MKVLNKQSSRAHFPLILMVPAFEQIGFQTAFRNKLSFRTKVPLYMKVFLPELRAEVVRYRIGRMGISRWTRERGGGDSMDCQGNGGWNRGLVRCQRCWSSTGFKGDCKGEEV